MLPKTSSKPNGKDLPAKGAEKKLLAAIERIRDNRPRNVDLQARAKAGKLKLNATTATMEAGCARRLAYAFDSIRQALGVDENDTKNPATEQQQPTRGRSLQDIVIDLRAEKKALEGERNLTLSQSASLVVRLRQMERDVAEEVRKVIRQSTRSGNSNQIAGNVQRLFPSAGG